MHDNRAFGGIKGVFCFGLRLNIVYFSLSAVLFIHGGVVSPAERYSATNKIHKTKMRSV